MRIMSIYPTDLSLNLERHEEGCPATDDTEGADLIIFW